MEKREFKDRVYNELARITAALGNAKRLEIIELLAQGERTVEKIASETGTSVANTSKHLQVLKAGNLVEIKRSGNFIFYRLSDDKVARIYSILRDFGTGRIAELERVVREFRSGKGEFESVSIDTLQEKMDKENIVFLDVRPSDEFNSGHISNALSIPFDQLSERLKEIPRDKEIIAYCRGPFCVFADDATLLLLKNNFKARRLKEGFPDWKLKGLAVSNNN